MSRHRAFSLTLLHRRGRICLTHQELPAPLYSVMQSIGEGEERREREREREVALVAKKLGVAGQHTFSEVPSQHAVLKSYSQS